jgi:hypothetical protein
MSSAISLRIDDPDDEIKSRHAQAIQNAQERISDVKFRAAEYDESLRNLAIYNAVQELCIKAEPLFKKTQNGRQYWNNTTVGGFVESPPAHAQQAQQSDLHRLSSTGTHSHLERKRVTINSLAEFVDINPKYEFRFVYGKVIGSRVDPNEFRSTRILPQRVSTKAQRLCNQYLNEIGLGISLEAEPETDGTAPENNDMADIKPNDP